MIRRRYFTFMVFLVVGLIILSSNTSGFPGEKSRPVFCIHPAGLQTVPGETFKVQVYVDPVRNGVRSASVELSFNPEVMEVKSIVHGHFLLGDPKPKRGFPRFDNEIGTIGISAKSSTIIRPPAKPGVLAEITFKTRMNASPGNYDIVITDAVLRTHTGEKISDVMIENITVKVVSFKKVNMLLHPLTKLPRKISGINVYPFKLKQGTVPLTKQNVNLVFKGFLSAHYKLLGVHPKNVKLIASRLVNKRWLVKYQQYYREIPVYHATVGLLSTQKGKVISFNSNYCPDISISVEPQINIKKAARVAARTYEPGKAAGLSARGAGLIIYPKRKNSRVTYHLAWKFLFAGDRPDPAVDKHFIIDAHKGVVLHSYLRYSPAQISGTLQGEVYPENPTAPPIAARQLPYAYVNVPGSSRKTTNVSGYYTTDTISSGSHTVTFTLEGPYARVQDNGGTDITTTANCNTSSSCNFTWTAADRDGINVFYHINVLHDWYQGRLGYSWVNDWDNTSQFKAEVNHTFNNAYAGSPMLFGTNNYARSSDVIYHECTHNVLHRLYGDYIGFSVSRYIEGYAFDEGFSDYFAGAITGDPRHGEGYGGTRTLDNNDQYPGKASYHIEGHTGGRIIAGAAWDLRSLLAEEMGADRGSRYADNLMFDAHHIMANQPREYFFSDPQESSFLTCLYMADDDNNNLDDGVPHFVEIHRCFSNHNLLQAVLHPGNSYDVSTNQVGFYSGGDFYISSTGKFYANNLGQRGLIDLGDIGTVPLDEIDIPDSGFTRFGVSITTGHTYVSLAQQGEEGNYIAFRVINISPSGQDITIEYFYHSRKLILYDKDSYDFSQQIRGELTGGDFYLSGNKFWANNYGQRGVIDLGNLGSTALEDVDIPTTGYTRFGVPVTAGHTYVSLAQQGEEGNYIVFKVLTVTRNTVTLEYLYVSPIVTLNNGNSYDFSERKVGNYTGGDLYFASQKFLANNVGQRGVIGLGNLGSTALEDVEIPTTGYTRFGVQVTAGHTYVSLAQQGEEGNYIVFKVLTAASSTVTLEYLYVSRTVTLSNGNSYDFSERKVGNYSGGDLYFSNSKFLANNIGQRGVIGLGNLGSTALEDVEIPTTGYTRFGVPVTAGHTYVSLAQQGEEGNYIVFKVLAVTRNSVTLEYLYISCTVTLKDGNSYDFSEKKFGIYSGGDFYYSSSKFYANNYGQRGVIDLGNLGSTALKDVEIPAAGYTRFGVQAIAGHTYVSLAQQGEEGRYIVFRVEAMGTDTVSITYYYTTPPGG